MPATIPCTDACSQKESSWCSDRSLSAGWLQLLELLTPGKMTFQKLRALGKCSNILQTLFVGWVCHWRSCPGNVQCKGLVWALDRGWLKAAQIVAAVLSACHREQRIGCFKEKLGIPHTRGLSCKPWELTLSIQTHVVFQMRNPCWEDRGREQISSVPVKQGKPSVSAAWPNPCTHLVATNCTQPAAAQPPAVGCWDLEAFRVQQEPT